MAIPPKLINVVTILNQTVRTSIYLCTRSDSDWHYPHYSRRLASGNISFLHFANWYLIAKLNNSPIPLFHSLYYKKLIKQNETWTEIGEL